MSKVNLIEYGLFSKPNEGNFVEDNIESPTGYFIRTDDIQLIDATSVISAKIGTIMGIKYLFNSSSSQEIVNFQCKIIHPTLNNPNTNELFNQTIENKSDYNNEINFDFYEFEENWELIPGIWTFQIFENDKLLFSQEFKVVV